MFHNGWEFFIINPFCENTSEVTQNLYLNKYKQCYNIFIKSLLIPDPLVLFTPDNELKTFTYYCNCEGDMDIINLDDDYGFKFLKSKFFEKKSAKIKKDLRHYYSSWNIKINFIYRDADIYYIELIKY